MVPLRPRVTPPQRGREDAALDVPAAATTVCHADVTQREHDTRHTGFLAPKAGTASTEQACLDPVGRGGHWALGATRAPLPGWDESGADVWRWSRLGNWVRACRIASAGRWWRSLTACRDWCSSPSSTCCWPLPAGPWCSPHGSTSTFPAITSNASSCRSPSSPACMRSPTRRWASLDPCGRPPAWATWSASSRPSPSRRSSTCPSCSSPTATEASLDRPSCWARSSSACCTAAPEPCIAWSQAVIGACAEARRRRSWPSVTRPR